MGWYCTCLFFVIFGVVHAFNPAPRFASRSSPILLSIAIPLYNFDTPVHNSMRGRSRGTGEIILAPARWVCWTGTRCFDQRTHNSTKFQNSPFSIIESKITFVAAGCVSSHRNVWAIPIRLKLVCVFVLQNLELKPRVDGEVCREGNLCMAWKFAPNGNFYSTWTMDLCGNLAWTGKDVLNGTEVNSYRMRHSLQKIDLPRSPLGDYHFISFLIHNHNRFV